MMILPIFLRGCVAGGRLHAYVFRVLLLLLLLAGGGAARAQTPVAPAWLMTQTDGSLTYFLFSNRVECYDAYLRTWRPTISLGRGGASKMAVNSTHLVVSFGQECHKYTLTGSPLGFLFKAYGQVDGLFLDGGLLLVSSLGSPDTLESVSFSTGGRYDVQRFDSPSYKPLLGVPVHNRLYGTTSSSFPGHGYHEYSDAGVFGTSAGFTGGHDFSFGRLAHVFPGKTLLVDTLGYIFGTEDRSHKGSFGGPVMDVVFNGEVPLLLRSSMVVSTHPTMYVETGRAAIHAETKKLAVSGADVLGFYPSVEPATGIEVMSVPLAALVPATPGPGVSPVGLSFTPDDVFVDKLGRVLVLSKSQKCVYLWDPLKYQWLGERWMLRGAPEHMTYNAETHEVYMAYASGEVGRIDLNEASPVERPLFNLPKGVTSLTAAGAYLHLEQFNKSYTFSAAGGKVGQISNSDDCLKYAWAPQGRKLYGVNGWNDLVCLQLAADGQMTAPSRSSSQTSYTNPVRVSPDEAYVLTGGGPIVATGTGLPLSGNLGNSVVDAAWLPGGIVAVRTQGTLTLVQRFSGVTFALQGTLTLEGTPLRVLALDGVGYVVMTMVGGRPVFRTYDAAHALVVPTGLPMPANFTATTNVGGGVSLGWEDVQAESGYEIQRSNDNGATWTPVTSPAAGAQGYFDTMAALGQTYLYRIRAVYPGGKYSSYTAPVPGARADPQKVTNLLGVLTNDLTTVQLTWTPSGDATSYLVMKRPSTGGNYAQLAELEPQVTSYLDATGTPGNAYEYAVHALKGTVSDSLRSPRVTVGVPLPDAPAAFSGVEVDSGVNLSWAAVPAVERYRLQRRVLPSLSFSSLTLPDPLATEFRDTKVIPGQAYEYRVLGVRKGVDSSTGPLVQVAVAPPVAPATLTASLDGTGVLLNWPPGSNLSSYRLERRLLPDGEFFYLNLPAPTVLSYLDTGVIPGASYAYQVRSLKAQGISVNAATVEVHLTGPQAPESVTAVFADPVVNVEWTPVPNVAGYRVQRRVQGGPPFVTVGTVTHPQTIFTDTTVVPGYTYEYRVLSAVGVAISNTAPAVQVNVPPPGTPGPLAATLETGRVVLTWGPATNITGYRLLRRTLPALNYTVLATVEVGTTRYEDTDLGQDVMYEYQVWGEKNGGFSPGPVTPWVAVPALHAPAEVTVSTRPGVATVRWSVVSGVTGYRVYRAPLNSQNWALVGQVGDSISEMVDTQATSGLSYQYGVQSVRGFARSSVSAVRVDVPLPGGPAGLVATLETGHVRLNWTALPGATGYRVERRLLPDGGFAPLAELTGEVTTLLDADVQGGKAYEYRIFSLVVAEVSPQPSGSVSITLPDHLLAIYRMASTTTGSRVGSFIEAGKLKPLNAAVRAAAKSYLVVDLTTEEASEVVYWSEVSAQTKKTVKYYRVADFDLPFTVLPAGVNKWHFSALESTQGTSTAPQAEAGPWARMRQFTAMAAPYTLLPAKISYPGLATAVSGRERYTFMGAVQPPTGMVTQEFKTFDVTWTGTLDVPLTNSTMTAAPLSSPEGPQAEKRSLLHAVRTVINSLVKQGHIAAP